MFYDCDKVLLLLINSRLWARKQRKAKEGRNTLDPLFWVKDNYAFEEEQIYEDTLNYNLNSGESGQNVADKSPSTPVFRESRPQNDYVQHPTFLGKTPITEYDELGLPTRFLNSPEEKVCFKLMTVTVLKL